MENQDYVAQRKNWTTIRIDTRWPVSSKEPLRRVLFRAFDIFCEAFESMMVITAVEAIVKERNPAMSETKLNKSLSDISGVKSPITLQNPAGLTIEDMEAMVSEIEVKEGMEVYIPSVNITDSNVKVYLEDGLFDLDPSTDDRYKFVTVTGDGNSAASKPLLWGKLGYAPGELAYGYDHPVFKWWINTPADIWFEDTIIGQINRARLHECFERLDDELDILEHNFVEGTVGVGQDDIDALFEYDGPSSEFLIQQHRRDWVEDELRPTETRSKSGDTRVLTWTAPDSVPGDELKTRVEVYVEAQQSEYQDIGRICVSQEESSVCGEIVGQNVEWESDGE